MKIKTLPNGNMDLRGIEFVTKTGFHVTIGPHSISHNGVYCHWLSWTDENGEPERHRWEYKNIVECFAKKTWRIKHVGKPVKMFSKFKF